MKKKKAKTRKDIESHPLVDMFKYQYDGPGVHMVRLIDGYRFHNTSCSSDIGSIKELCDSLNNYVEAENE